MAKNYLAVVTINNGKVNLYHDQVIRVFQSVDKNSIFARSQLFSFNKHMKNTTSSV